VIKRYAILILGVFIVMFFAGVSDASEKVLMLKWPSEGGHVGEPQRIISGTSQVFRFDRSIVRAAISDIKICDVVPIKSDEILIYAKQTGKVNFILWDEWNNTATYDIESTVDTEKLHDLLRNIDPKADLRIIPFGQTVAVYGFTETAEKLEEMKEVTEAFHEDAINYVKIRDPKQVLLEVRFAEVSRKDNSDYHLDLEFLSRFLSGRSMTGQTGISDATLANLDYTFPGGPITYDDLKIFSPSVTKQSVSNLVFTYFSQSVLITPVLEWLEEKNILKIIARPNLLAKDGEKASFLVGGEFAIPVATNNSIAIEYQKYGTRVDFTPYVGDNNMIRLEMDIEVSELDFTNVVTISSTTVPSVITREQSTVAELKDGQSLVIGGMITQNIRRINKKFPILGDIPLLKILFKNETFTRTDVELLIVVTPHIVKPMDLEENKLFYEPENVRDGIRLIRPPYMDSHGDAISKMIAQGEGYSYFDKIHENKVGRPKLRTAKRKKETEKRRKKVRERERYVMDIVRRTERPVYNNDLLEEELAKAKTFIKNHAAPQDLEKETVLASSE